MDDIDNVIEGLESLRKNMEQMNQGFFAGICDDAIYLLKEKEFMFPIIASSEDCPWATYYVCPKCKISIDYHDKYCRYCGGEMRWND